ncbi:MAG: glycoside hydrolase family 31 protein [Rudaea sp.]|uniref:glycoside hydrolase family 31 protein n=1 Tax=unclassified Rudaea TaxID=2627037 RepID=UPI0010F4B3F6|nr:MULTISPECIES: glycoside hydrolase family 31 protein [unclassified Rudaea]MBN8885138.1 glycoside hydrolase family 31 protein [Rudaea sp.]
MYRKTMFTLGLGVLSLVGTPMAAYALEQTIGAVTAVAKDGQSASFKTASGAQVNISFVASDVVRVRVSPRGNFNADFSYAVQTTVPAAIALQLDENTDRIELRAASGRSARVVVIRQPNLLITIYDAQGRLVVSDDPAEPLSFDPQTGAIETSKLRDEFELYYGLGEQALPFSRDHQFMTMWNTDTFAYRPGTNPIYQSIPFFIAMEKGRSYGVFFDNTWRSRFDMGKTSPKRYTFGAEGGEMNYYVFTGGTERTPANVLREYTALVGRGPLPALWTLGYQQSRYSYESQEKVEQIAQTFRDKHIPADAIYLDIDHMDGYRIFTWSPQAFPQPKKMLAKLHDQGFHAVTIVDPGIKTDENFAIYRSGRDRGAYVRDAAGNELHETVWPGVCAFPDFTDPAARAWWGELYRSALDDGVDGFWNDMDEPGVFASSGLPILFSPNKTFPLDARHVGDGQADTHARYHNVYGLLMARSSFEGLKKLRPDRRPFVITRAGYAGVQRYALVWSGDNDATWDHLALTIPLLTNLSVSGVAFVGADVGGFARTATAELYTRWLQAAALMPFYRTHSMTGTEQREPWTHGGDYERINRASIELRYRLLPYLYSVFAENERSGLGVIRPLWLEHADDAKTYLVDDEFLVGRDLLVAPIVEESAVRRKVYFPQGADWIDWWDGSRHSGGTEAYVDAPLDRLPLYARAGAAIPVQPIVQHTGEMKSASLTLVIAGLGSASSEIYQDAGDGYGYRQGESRTIKIATSGTTVNLDIPKSPAYQPITAIEWLGVEAAPSAIVDGKARRNVTYDAATHRLHMPLAKESIKRISLSR